jgi:hypothetical protein
MIGPIHAPPLQNNLPTSFTLYDIVILLKKRVLWRGELLKWK